MKILLTGGAGFIGSNLTEAFLNDVRVEKLRILDNFSTGYWHNIEEFKDHPKFEFIEGDIRDIDTCLRCCEGMDAVCHQAALGSVPRSINDPITSNNVNITGQLNILWAMKEKGVKKIVFAASSSTYGDSPELPKLESRIGKPLSPYAVTKYVNELYADVFSKTYDISFIGLRYFNIFGPKQNINGPYAAVIPLFITKILKDESPVINGNGMQSRDFTFVKNAVQANLIAIFSEREESWNEIYNIACGDTTSLNEMFESIRAICGSQIHASHGPDRKGDIKDSLADISKAKRLLGYSPEIRIHQGLELTFKWFQANLQGHKS